MHREIQKNKTKKCCISDFSWKVSAETSTVKKGSGRLMIWICREATGPGPQTVLRSTKKSSHHKSTSETPLEKEEACQFFQHDI